MKHLLTFIILIAIFSACNQHPVTDQDKFETTAEVSSYDSVLAAKFGADDYGMKKYVMAYLKRGPNPSKDSATRMELQKAHMENIGRLAEAGNLVLAGPFLDDGDTRGIYIFNVTTLEEAKKLTETDPAIQAGALEMELHPWYGSAALMQVNELHKKISKINI